MNKYRLKSSFILFAAVLGLTLSVASQELPKKIRGYRVHDKIIKLTSDVSRAAERPYIVVGTPTISDVSLGGVTLAIAGELEAAGFDGRVEMMTFHNFRVNDVPIEVAEFTEPFKVHKTGKTALPSPATVFLPTAKILNAAWKEVTDSKNDWTVTGRVFVFGKFKKIGFHFKRAIPVDVRVSVKTRFWNTGGKSCRKHAATSL